MIKLESLVESKYNNFIYGLSGALRMYKRTGSLPEEVKNSGLSSHDIFQFNSLFKIPGMRLVDISSGNLHKRIKASYIDNEVISINLKKADALLKFIEIFAQENGPGSSPYAKFAFKS